MRPGGVPVPEGALFGPGFQVLPGSLAMGDRASERTRCYGDGLFEQAAGAGAADGTVERTEFDVVDSGGWTST